MKKILIIVAGVILALGLSFTPAPVKADYIIDFGIISPTGGTIYYTGGITPLYGVGIDVDNYTGIGTPLNNGVTVPLIGYYLNFTTGNLTSSNSSHWYFGPGGSITISGLTTTLLTGFFTSVEVAVVDSTYKVTAGLLDTKDPNLLAFFGLSGDTYEGKFNISFNTDSLSLPPLPPEKFTGSELLDGYLSNKLVPEPATILLIGSGLLGLWGLRRKFRK